MWIFFVRLAFLFHFRDWDTHTHTQDNQGVWHTDERRITIIAEDYYKGLFISSNPVNMDGVLNSVERVVTDGMNQTLTNSYTCRGRSKGVTFSDAPLEGTRTGWHVTLFLSKVLAHSRARRYLYYSISFTFWYSVSIKWTTHIMLIPKKNNL